MSSILTNNGAMVALQTLQSINKGLEMTQNEIATGKTVATAKDNAAVWAISKVMESDVSGFNAISDSLGLGESTVAVARNAAETTTDLLKQMKEKIVASQEENVDRDKIQTDIVALRDHIASVVGAAQFNGLNLLSNQDGAGDGTAAITAQQLSDAQGSGTVSILSSLDRSTTGVASGNIDVTKQDLGTNATTFAAGNAADTAAATTAVTGAGAIADGASGTLTIVGHASVAATSERSGIAVVAGDGYRIAGSVFGATGNIDYVARDGDTINDIADGLSKKINETLLNQDISGFTVSSSGAGITIANNSGAGITTAVTVGSGGRAGGGLESLTNIDVSTQSGASAALVAIEDLIQTSIDSAAAFGSSQSRIETQADFVSSLTDALKSGIGTLVDADMEEASARLQALQVQQQLGVQALSIANQAPQQLLSLFR